MTEEKAYLGAPLSEHAKTEMGRLWEKCWIHSIVIGFLGFTVCFCTLVVLGVMAIDGKGVPWRTGVITWLVAVVIVTVSCLISEILRGTYGAPRKQAIIETNASDYLRAVCLKTKIFPRFADVPSDQFPVREGPLDGRWRAFRVEHFASQSLRGDISGKVCLSLKALFTGRSEVSAEVRQLAVPDLVDMSSVVFFENDRGETLRVLVPSPRATKEMLARLIEFYVGKEDSNGWRSGGTLTRGTHVYEALRQFTTGEPSLLTPISHPVLLDHLDVATQRPSAARPAVRVIGERIQDGVALATALVVDGVKRIFFPSGFLGELNSGIAFALDQNRKPAELLETVR